MSQFNFPTKFTVPCRVVFDSVLQDMRDRGTEEESVVGYSVIWYMATGRSFTGLDRVAHYMTRGTVKAFAKRVAREMRANAAKRGSQHIVTGDLDNAALARALGFADVADATHTCCRHAYGARFTLGK